jgi:DNA-binding beta-propeller fold protein YncE
MAVYGNTVYVTAVKRGLLLLINSGTDQIEDSIILSTGAKNIVIDKHSNLWVLCDGTLADVPIPSALYCIDPALKKIIHRFNFPDKNSAGNLQINGTRDTILYNFGGVIKMGISEASLALTPVIKGNFYGIGIDPAKNAIYTTDSKGFISKGVVFRYNDAGNFQKSFQTGVGPNGFLFVP